MIKLKLKNALSYNGVVSANEKSPFVEVKSKEAADKAVKTGYFEVVEEQEPKEPKEPEVHTKASLKKLNKEQQEAIISQAGWDPSTAKNEEDRISFILEIQDSNPTETEE
ncbi:hypothetical protein SAMN04487943_11250 [Gracilibacillus orientalis]|uniref:YqbF C-terminal domain-containing protein n=1 Tax=Gracilibacillus orientalis TaxID=334253 RepID=A0A1I4PMR5_9BACI|nr:hypothetical protein [Gracilibacillus orientalis]SFM29057.1 hypothetical protein SAMN04487943_11250 [Gracilibacillus orientalis]